MAQDGFNVFDIPLTQIGAADIELVEKDDPQTTRAWSPNGSPMKTSSKFPKGGDGSAHFQLSQDPSMKLTGGKTHRKSVGTLDEVSTMARAARVELTAFCSAVLPEKMTYWETLMFGMLIFNFRKPVDVLMRCIPLLDRHLKQRREFTRSIIAIGGLERVQLLIAIARFDTDGDNSVSEMEFMKSAYAGGVCVTNAVSVVQGFNLMASLIFVATHLANIGRPKPWYASPETVESFGAEESSIVMWVAYSLNCFAETLALSIMINSVFMRQLLVNALPSVMSKLVFLADTNIVSFIATTTTWMIFALVWVVALGGYLAVPTHGFVTSLMPLTVVCIVVPPIYPAFYTAAVRLYYEANAALRLGEGAVDAREVGKGVDLDVDDDDADDCGGMD
jgi:hypothetical protein